MKLAALREALEGRFDSLHALLIGKPVIYLRDPDLSGLRIVSTRGWARDPAVSPGGRRLAFARRGRVGSQVWATYLDGVGLAELTTGPRDGGPGWSPAGDAITFARGPAGGRDIFTVRADGTGLRRLTHRASDDHSPSWSVTQRIAFVRRRRGPGDIHVMPAAGGRARQLTDSPAAEGSPAWSPSGRTLAFSRGRPGRRDRGWPAALERRSGRRPAATVEPPRLRPD